MGRSGPRSRYASSCAATRPLASIRSSSPPRSVATGTSTCESLELFARAVAPEFREGAAAREEAKREDLAGAVRAALDRRPPPPVADSGYVIGPLDSGPPAVRGGGEDGGGAPGAAEEDGGATRLSGLAARAQQRGGEALGGWVRRASDRGLERTAGSRAGLALLFGEMARRFEPERAAGFEGDIVYLLSGEDGASRAWTIAVSGGRAVSRAGSAPAPRLVVSLGLADFVRLAAGDLDPGRLLLTGRLDIEGDLAVAARLGEMFGQPAAY